MARRRRRAEKLDRELVGLARSRRRIREIAALLVVERRRRRLGLTRPNRRPCTCPSPAIPAPAKRLSRCAWRTYCIGLGYVRKGHLVSVTRDDLVGQYIGHTAPKTKEILKKAMGGVLFIDEAYYLYRPENERDYGQEAIEILLQVMENQREDLVVILAGYAERMDRFFAPIQAFAPGSPTISSFPIIPKTELTADRRNDARPAQFQIQHRRTRGVQSLH